MALASPVRALLSAHLQTAWNRGARELGESGRFAAAALAALLGLVLGVLIVGGGALLGVSLGPEIGQPSVALALGGILGVLSVVCGVLGGILGGSRTLAWEAAKAYPLRLRDLLAAELVASLATAFPILTAPLSAAILSGVGIAQPRTLPLLPVVWASAMVSQLCLQHLVGSLAAHVVKSIRTGLLVLGLVAVLGPLLAPKRPGRAARAVEAATGAAVSPGRDTSRVVRFAKLLPPCQAALGLGDAARGEWRPALGRQLPAAASAALLVLAAAWVLRRDAEPRARRGSPGGRERLWTFTSPARGVARLHWHSLVSSHPGRLGFLMPLLAVCLFRGAAPSVLGGSQPWSITSALVFLSLSSARLHLNQFGLDGPGVKALLLLPIGAEDLLRGKLRGMALYQGAQVLLLLLLSWPGGGLSPVHAPAGLCLAACVSLATAGLGHWTSAWLPRPLPRDSFRNASQASLVGWVGVAASVLAVAFFGGIYALCAWRTPAALVPVMLLALGLTLLAYRSLVLPAAARFLDRRREALVLALG